MKFEQSVIEKLSDVMVLISEKTPCADEDKNKILSMYDD